MEIFILRDPPVEPRRRLTLVADQYERFLATAGLGGTTATRRTARGGVVSSAPSYSAVTGVALIAF
jgi:hypothetical protein